MTEFALCPLPLPKTKSSPKLVLDHKTLCAIAVKWLKRPTSQKAHGCIVAASELRSGWDGEIPDAIGFRLNGNQPLSVVIEAKVSRADFLADKNKTHRQAGGMGNFRYYICPEGLIDSRELPKGWGLLWVNGRGHVKPIEGAIAYQGNWIEAEKQKLNWIITECDKDREMWLLIKLLSRIGDQDQMNEWIKESKRVANHYMLECDKLQKRNKEMSLKLLQLSARLKHESAS
jgi:hypothetical protein